MKRREEMFDRYAELLGRWGRKLNLTSITSPDDIRAKHFEDSLAPLPYLTTARSLLDLGTGAGFPGIPLKICSPDLRVVLVDATRKKVSFCNEVIRVLRLTDIEALHGRAEDVSLIEALGTFDAVISRATWPLDVYLEMAVPYCNNDGIVIAMRGAAWESDLKTATDVIERLKLGVAGTHAYSIGDNEKRCLLIFRR